MIMFVLIYTRVSSSDDFCFENYRIRISEIYSGFNIIPEKQVFYAIFLTLIVVFQKHFKDKKVAKNMHFHSTYRNFVLYWSCYKKNEHSSRIFKHIGKTEIYYLTYFIISANLSQAGLKPSRLKSVSSLGQTWVLISNWPRIFAGCQIMVMILLTYEMINAVKRIAKPIYLAECFDILLHLFSLIFPCLFAIHLVKFSWIYCFVNTPHSIGKYVEYDGQLSELLHC